MLNLTDIEEEDFVLVLALEPDLRLVLLEHHKNGV